MTQSLSLSLLQAWQPLVHFLSLWTFHINGIIYYVSSFYHLVFQVHPCCNMYWYFIPFYGSTVFQIMGKSTFVYSFTSWTNGSFQVLGDYTTTTNIHIQVSVWICFHISWAHKHNKIAGSYGKFMFNWHILFQSYRTTLYSHQQYIRVPVYPHSHQHLLLFYYNHPSGDISLWF